MCPILALNIKCVLGSVAVAVHLCAYLFLNLPPFLSVPLSSWASQAVVRKNRRFRYSDSKNSLDSFTSPLPRLIYLENLTSLDIIDTHFKAKMG